MSQPKIWKDIPYYEGLYQASSSGEIRSIDRVVIRPIAGNMTLKGRLLRQYRRSNGYIMTILSKGGNCKSFQVHRLVATTFLGISEMDIDHINGVRSDNNVTNLRYCSRRQNCSFENRKDFKGMTSRFVGVHWYSQAKKWKATIYYKGKIKYLGLHETEEAASAAYQNELLIINKTSK